MLFKLFSTLTNNIILLCQEYQSGKVMISKDLIDRVNYTLDIIIKVVIGKKELYTFTEFNFHAFKLLLENLDKAVKLEYYLIDTNELIKDVKQLQESTKIEQTN